MSQRVGSRQNVFIFICMVQRVGSRLNVFIFACPSELGVPRTYSYSLVPESSKSPERIHIHMSQWVESKNSLECLDSKFGSSTLRAVSTAGSSYWNSTRPGNGVVGIALCFSRKRLAAALAQFRPIRRHCKYSNGFLSMRKKVRAAVSHLLVRPGL